MTIKKIMRWAGIVILIGLIGLMIVRMPSMFSDQITSVQVNKIHSTKLTLDDVMGKNLPPDPGTEANKTVAGIDVNKNGIRDDVELAIFKEYPNSAKTRAVLLQYALALQMEFIQPIVNKETVTEVVREENRANSCVADILVPRKTPESSRSYAEMEKINTYIDFVNKLQINTKDRDSAQIAFYKYIKSYSSLPKICDIDYSILSN